MAVMVIVAIFISFIVFYSFCEMPEFVRSKVTEKRRIQFEKKYACE